MSAFEYSPGDTLLVAGPTIAVLADIDPMGDVSRMLVEHLADPDASVDSVLELIVRPGLRAVENFAVLGRADESSRVVLRGSFRGVREGEADLLGRGLWSDHTLAGADVTLTASDPGYVWLPLQQGAVLAAAFRVLGGRGVAAPEVAVATVRASDLVRPPASSAPPQPGQPSHQPTPDPEPSSPAPSDVPAPPSAAQDAGPALEDFDALFDLQHTRSQLTLTPPDAEHPAPDHPVEHQGLPAPPDAVVQPGSAGHTMPSPLTGDRPSTPDASPRPMVSPPRPPAPSGFISSFPWATGNDQPPPPPPVAPPAHLPPQPAPANPASMPPAGMVPPSVPAPTAPMPVPGQSAPEAPNRTINRANLRVPAGGASAPSVMATRCPRGHLNPPWASTCRVCGAPVPPQQPVQTPRPPLGVLRLSNGGTVLLDRAAFLGRNPRVPSGYLGEQPNLVQLPDPERDISSQHLEVRLEDWHVSVADLGSTNGTQVILPGAPPVTLRPRDPIMIEPRTKVVIAGVFSFVFEVVA